ncbi:DUF2017 family protein [Cryobacterium tagatosivorans]|uniref:DUF2017 family protein n=1 Tax=Cryobacterium tagatosivorans TaxID=1259199 RepID=A0A4V3I633_9MICO|nr:DUF2017 family protein [Cryobacterium tagatosivorans]TFB46774.1 DUF2017 family protein [Cryobacterium tagatosivorans]
MMRFTREASGNVSGQFFPVEIDLLRLAVSQLIDLLDAAASHALGASADPAVRRLLPDAYREDAEAAAEFRRFTADGLIDRKEANARAVLASLGEEEYPGDADERDAAEHDADEREDEPGASVGADGPEDLPPVTVLLDDAAVQSWLRTLTDLRLTLAERLEITPDGVQHLSGEEAPFLANVYEWLGMVQESLVHAIDV